MYTPKEISMMQKKGDEKSRRRSLPLCRLIRFVCKEVNMHFKFQLGNRDLLFLLSRLPAFDALHKLISILFHFAERVV